MADWSRAYSAWWRVRRVDTDTWECVGDVDGVTSATVTRGSDELGECGSFELSLSPSDPLPTGWVRIEAVVEQDGESEVADVATLLMVEGDSTYERGVRRVTAAGLSVLWPASARAFRGGSYAPRGVDGAAWVAELLAGCIDAPVTADGGFTLTDFIVFKSGTSYLDAARQVLDAAGWRLRVDGRGEVLVCPPPSEPALDVSPSNVADGIALASAVDDVPNTYVAVEGTQVEVAVNDDPASPTSTVSMGYPVELVDASPKRVDGESLAGYAERRLLGARMQAVRTYTWTRDFAPDVVPGDLVHATVPSAALDAVLRVESQTLACAQGLTLQESAAQMEVV